MPSAEIAPFASNGDATITTLGSAAAEASTASISDLTVGSLTPLDDWKTMVALSPDCAGNRSSRRSMRLLEFHSQNIG